MRRLIVSDTASEDSLEYVLAWLYNAGKWGIRRALLSQAAADEAVAGSLAAEAVPPFDHGGQKVLIITSAGEQYMELVLREEDSEFEWLTA